MKCNHEGKIRFTVLKLLSYCWKILRRFPFRIGGKKARWGVVQVFSLASHFLRLFLPRTTFSADAEEKVFLGSERMREARARRHSKNGDDSANKKLSWSESFEKTQQTSYGGKNSLIVGMNIFHFTLLLKCGIAKRNFFCSWVCSWISCCSWYQEATIMWDVFSS